MRNASRTIIIAAVAFFFIPSSLFARVPNDADYGSQWVLQQVQAERAWEVTTGSPGVVVAIIDSGVDLDHPDLLENLWTNKKEIPDDGIDNDGNGYVDDVHGWDFVTNDNFPNPKFSSQNEVEDRPRAAHHGTLIAGIIGARGNNERNIVGVNWQVSLMPLRAVNSRGNANLEDILEAFDYAINQQVDIITLSFIGNESSALLQERIARAVEKNIVVVAAAGNDDEESHGIDLDRSPRYPVCHDGEAGENFVIGVAATDPLDQKANFSHYGSKCIDIAAPGVGFYSTTVYAPRFGFNTYASGPWSGTSFATPLVAGTAALLRSIDKNLTPKQIRELIVANADNIDGVNQKYIGKLGAGRLNIGKTIEAAVARNKQPPMPFVRSSFLLTGPVSGVPPEVQVRNMEGDVLASWMAFDRQFRGGVRFAAGDLDGDGQAEVIVAPGKGGGPFIRIFDTEGKLKKQFLAFEKSFRGGVQVAVGDVDGDGVREIIVAPENDRAPEIRIFTPDGKKKKLFFAYEKTFRGGVRLALVDFDGDGRLEIVTAPGVGGRARIRVWTERGDMQSEFFAFEKTYRGGVRMIVGEGEASLIVAREKKPFEAVSFTQGGEKKQMVQPDGMIVGRGDFAGDGQREFVVLSSRQGVPSFQIITKEGETLSTIQSFPKTWKGGVSVGVIP